MNQPKAIIRGTPRVDRKGGTREIRSPRVGVLVVVACAWVHGVAQALLPHSPTHTHTVRQTTVGVGSWVAMVAPRAARGSVHDGVGGDCDCDGVVALSLWTLGWWKGSNGLAVVHRLSGSRNPSEWSVALGFNLNGPLASVSICMVR